MASLSAGFCRGATRGGGGAGFGGGRRRVGRACGLSGSERLEDWLDRGVSFRVFGGLANHHLESVLAKLDLGEGVLGAVERARQLDVLVRQERHAQGEGREYESQAEDEGIAFHGREFAARLPGKPRCFSADEASGPGT